MCVWQEGNERQAMPSSKPIGAEAPEPDSTSSEGDTRREHNRRKHVPAQGAAAETWWVALGGLVGPSGWTGYEPPTNSRKVGGCVGK